jgi:hypothetical protein
MLISTDHSIEGNEDVILGIIRVGSRFIPGCQYSAAIGDVFAFIAHGVSNG